MIVAFTLSITPVAKGRPRFGNGRAYTDPKTRSFERAVAVLARKAYPGPPLTGPIGLELTFHLPRPKSAPKRVVWPAVRPDLDNQIKGVKDALNGILYGDDGQVCILAARKVYGSPSRIDVRAWVIGALGAHDCQQCGQRAERESFET